MLRLFVYLLCVVAVAACEPRQYIAPQVIDGIDEPRLIDRPASLKFAVIGDSGRWSGEQRQNAAQLAAQRSDFSFDFVLMLGDNNYGDGSPQSYRQRFEEPFKPLLDAGVKFYAVVGNHDVGPQWNYPLFNMGGQRYYMFERKAGVLPPLAGTRVEFFALDTVNLDDDQLVWVDRQLSASKADWKIIFQHHPLYTSGRYVFSSALLRSTLEQVIVQHQVDVVFAGHEHLYERFTPQSGVLYFISGAAGSVRTGDLNERPFHAAGYDRDLSFMLIEIAGDALYFRAINRVGAVVDAGKVIRRKTSS